jgi:hypothetical protein
MGTWGRMALMAGAWAPEDQIEKDKHSNSNRTNEIPGFLHILSGEIRSLIPNCFGLPLAPGFVHPGLLFSPFHSRTNKIEDSV